MKTYICPKGCSISDKNERCKRCGEWLLYAGEKNEEQIEKISEELTLGRLPSNIKMPNK